MVELPFSLVSCPIRLSSRWFDFYLILFDHLNWNCLLLDLCDFVTLLLSSHLSYSAIWGRHPMLYSNIPRTKKYILYTVSTIFAKRKSFWTSCELPPIAKHYWRTFGPPRSPNCKMGKLRGVSANRVVLKPFYKFQKFDIIRKNFLVKIGKIWLKGLCA